MNIMNMRRQWVFPTVLSNYAMMGITCLLLTLAVSCTKDDYLRYNPDTASLRFVYTAAGNDSTVYSFGLYPGTVEGKVEIPFKLIGLSADEAREVVVEVVKEKTTAVENTDFIIQHCELPANAIEGVLEVTLKKNAELTTGSRWVTLRLCGNNHFGPAPVNEATFRIVITNELTVPDGWIFNEYSRVKHEFVILHTGVATDYNKWSTSEQIYWRGVLINALYEYNKAHPGKPLTDENGLVVTF